MRHYQKLLRWMGSAGMALLAAQPLVAVAAPWPADILLFSQSHSPGVYDVPGYPSFLIVVALPGDHSPLVRSGAVSMGSMLPSVSTNPACSETGSCYGQISDATGLPRDTFVHAYTRADGTHVGSYYRSE